MNRSDVWDAAYEDGFERGVEAGRLDAVPPDVEPMPWCGEHDEEWAREDDNITGCFHRSIFAVGTACRREDPVKHWRTA